VNLAEFVEETLSEILTGIRAAQKREGGGDVAAGFSATTGVLASNLFKAYEHTFTVVDFDVSCAAETTAGGKAGIRVMSIGAEGGGGHKSQKTSRVKFSVHLRIPEGDPAKKPGGF
jgi:Trypsin-co-occurring domain 2